MQPSANYIETAPMEESHWPFINDANVYESLPKDKRSQSIHVLLDSRREQHGKRLIQWSLFALFMEELEKHRALTAVSEWMDSHSKQAVVDALAAPSHLLASVPANLVSAWLIAIALTVLMLRGLWAD